MENDVLGASKVPGFTDSLYRANSRLNQDGKDMGEIQALKKTAFEDTGVQQCWSVSKYHLLRAQEQAIPECWQSNRWSRSLTWLRRDLLLELRRKNKVYGHWERGWVTWEDYGVAVCHCRERIHAAKAQLELKLASTARAIKRVL